MSLASSSDLDLTTKEQSLGFVHATRMTIEYPGEGLFCIVTAIRSDGEIIYGTHTVRPGRRRGVSVDVAIAFARDWVCRKAEEMSTSRKGRA